MFTLAKVRAVLRGLPDRLPPRVAFPMRARLGHPDPEVAVLGRFVSRGDTVIDVGAHKGAYTWPLARLVGPSGAVHAFEPQPDLARRLRRGLSRHVTVHELALSDGSGGATLNIPVWGTTLMQGHASLEPKHEGEGQQVNVGTACLDDLGLAPTFMKVDVEGHEAALLRGAAATITTCRPTLLVEIDYRHQNEQVGRNAVLEWLAHHGYTAHYVCDAQLRPAGELDPDHDPNERLPGPYVYNWFFLPDQ